MKTFNYESNCVKYKNCFFDLGEYEKCNSQCRRKIGRKSSCYR